MKVPHPLARARVLRHAPRWRPRLRPPLPSPAKKERTTHVKIAVIGGGPGGLYFSLLMRKAVPRSEIVVVERNRPDDTFEGVASDETLGNFPQADVPTHERITEGFVH
ncbi:MAG: hypothetical protein U0168_31265 [Nannocystaceae bacterium]